LSQVSGIPQTAHLAHFQQKGRHMNKTIYSSGVLKRVFGAAVLALASATAAQAAVVTFEGNTGQVLNQTTTFQELGYTVNFIDPGASAPPGSIVIGRFIDGSDPTACGASLCPTNNATTYLDLLNTGFIDILATSGATFSFSGLDASLIGTLGTQYPNFPAAIQVLGVRADGSTEQIQFDIPNTIAFQTFNAADVTGGVAFSEQSFVEIAIYGLSCDAAGQCSGLDASPGDIGLDNIRLSDVPISNIPEPTSFSLLALGLLSLGIYARRRA
jgi:hypothetical protein